MTLDKGWVYTNVPFFFNQQGLLIIVDNRWNRLPLDQVRLNGLNGSWLGSWGWVDPVRKNYILVLSHVISHPQVVHLSLVMAGNEDHNNETDKSNNARNSSSNDERCAIGVSIKFIIAWLVVSSTRIGSWFVWAAAVESATFDACICIIIVVPWAIVSVQAIVSICCQDHRNNDPGKSSNDSNCEGHSETFIVDQTASGMYKHSIRFIIKFAELSHLSLLESQTQKKMNREFLLSSS